MKDTGCHIRRYDPQADRELWDKAVSVSRNGTFLFCRTYMDYHADRFEDCSLIAEIRGHQALLPACLARTASGAAELHSHPGLTYGGWVLPRNKLDGTAVLDIYRAMLTWVRKENISAVVIKPVPYIYHTVPSQEEEYALWRCGARQDTVNLASVINMRSFTGFDYMHRRYLGRVSSEHPVIRRLQADELAPFHAMLTTCLAERHGASPVHTLDQLQLLMSRFPDQIQVHALHDSQQEMHAGVCLYVSPNVVHCQYIACSGQGRQRRYLPWLFHNLIGRFSHIPYFDFGTSNEAGGTVLNPTLHAFKFGHGAGSVTYPSYRITL